MRFSTAIRLCFLTLLVLSCSTAFFNSGATATQRELNDAKAALVLSTDLYDAYMKVMGSRYQLGTCDDICKARAIQTADVYLTAARAMKAKLDSGRVDFVTDYQTIFDAIGQLYALVTKSGAVARPNTLPAPTRFQSLVAPPRAFPWPPAAIPQPQQDARGRR